VAGARPRPTLLALALAIVAFALYARTAGFGFVEFDDPAYVRDNAHLEHGLTGASLRWALTSTAYQYNWHPLTWLSHALDVTLFGGDPGPMHLVNAGLHALATALLFLALCALTARTWPSALAAALFALHPLRVESVARIAQRKDVLAGVFFAATLLAWAAYVRAPSVRRRFGVALAPAAGLMSKPTLVTLPGVLLLLDFWPLGRLGGAPPEPGARALPRVRARRVLLEKLPLVALCAGAAALTLLAQTEGGAVRAALPLGARLSNALVAYVGYLGAYLVPRGLAVLVPHPALVDPQASHAVAALGAGLLLAAGLVLAWRARQRAPWLGVGACWFLGVLVPMIGLVQVGNQAHADRYAYLSMIGVEIALAWSAAALWDARPAWRPGVLGLALGWPLLLGALTTRQLSFWRDSEALFEHALAVTEGNFVIENQLGLALVRERRIEEAAPHFAAAAHLRPGFYEAELNLGKAHALLGALEPAQAALERALAARPTSTEARLSLAEIVLRRGDAARADALLAEALEHEPRLADDARARRLGQQIAARLEGE